MYISIGSILPFTVTLSICLKFFYVIFVVIFLNYPDIKIMEPNYFVAASKRDAIFTFGLKYEASILYSDPMAPSIAQPICKPKPILTE